MKTLCKDQNKYNLKLNNLYAYTCLPIFQDILCRNQHGRAASVSIGCSPRAIVTSNNHIRSRKINITSGIDRSKPACSTIELYSSRARTVNIDFTCKR